MDDDDWVALTERYDMEIEGLREENEKLRAEIERLRYYLAFYANADRYAWVNWRNDGSDPYTNSDDSYLRDIMRDSGEYARAALAAKGE